jgi:drug/metabolite transporter (DMT)-like permease
VQLPWYLAALGAAVAWGIHYPLVGFALKRVSLVFVLVLTALPIVLLAPFFYRRLGADLAALAAMSAAERWTVLALAATSLAGAVFLFLSIAAKNATLAALLEITYPVFVALFAWLLFREVHWNASVLAGAVLVFTGVAVIIWHNP